jgi:hypothetical protein
VSAASETKIGGMKLGAEPKKVAILAALLAGAIGMFIYNSQSGGNESPSPEQVHTALPVSSAPIGTPRARTHPARRTVSARERGTLRIQTVDPRNGDVDPTLRLDLLTRLQSIQPLEGGRSLFEMGPAPVTTPKLPLPVQIIPKPLPGPMGTNPTAIAEPVVNIPLKFYGFVRPKDKTGSNRGFFLDGDNILVASEGDLLKQRYLVVELTPSSAKMEDTQLKKGQTLPLVPEARNEF